MPFNLETYESPFWAKSFNNVRGHDPLGVQNSSISTYATLLPGMTNLTQRLRYYGFYLFLLSGYAELDDEDPFKLDAKQQYKFVRRAELILAYLMQFKLAVIGSTHTGKHYQELEADGYLDIAKGADKHKANKKGI